LFDSSPTSLADNTAGIRNVSPPCEDEDATLRKSGVTSQRSHIASICKGRSRAFSLERVKIQRDELEEGGEDDDS
jgi:hypothetical protein